MSIMNEQTKACTKCGKVLPEMAFYKERGHRSSRCPDCHKSRVAKWAKDNPDRHNANGMQWKKNNPDKVKDSALRYLFGITLKEYDRLLANQNGVCAVCKITPREVKRLAVDHDHAHCKGCRECVRGLLCDNCNRNVISVIEKHAYLQSAFTRRYLNTFPFRQRRTKIGHGLVESESIIFEQSHSWVPGTGELTQSELPVQRPG